MNLPAYPKPGERIHADWGRAVIDYLRSLTPRGSATVETQHLPGGVTYNVKPGTPGRPPGLKPFQLVDASESDGGGGIVHKVRVVYSTIAGQLPTGFSEGDDPPYKLTVSGTGVVWGLVVLKDDYSGIIEDGAIGLDFGASLPADDAFTRHILIGSYNVSGDVLTVVNARYGPIDVFVCRDWFSNPASYQVQFSSN